MSSVAPPIITFKGAGPNFFSMRRINLIHALVESCGNLIQLLIATHHVYELRFSIPFIAGVDVRDIKFSNLLILRYIVASENLLRCFITAVLQASAEIPCCLVYRSLCERYVRHLSSAAEADAEPT